MQTLLTACAPPVPLEREHILSRYFVVLFLNLLIIKMIFILYEYILSHWPAVLAMAGCSPLDPREKRILKLANEILQFLHVKVSSDHENSMFFVAVVDKQQLIEED